MEKEILALYKQGKGIFDIIQDPKFSYIKVRNALRKYCLLGLSYKEDIRIRNKVEYLLEFSDMSIDDIALMFDIPTYFVKLINQRRKKMEENVATLYILGYSATKIKETLDIRDKDIQYYFKVIGAYKPDYKEVFELANQGYSKTSIAKYLRISYKKVNELLGGSFKNNHLSLNYRDAQTIKFYYETLGYSVSDIVEMTNLTNTQILHDVNK